ncbi:MAG: hypothetical protein R3A44_35740 [Caldilineaceae bacterium]
MSQFMLGVIASLVASVVFSVCATFLLSRHFRKHVALAFSLLSGSGVEYVYRSDREAEEDMLRYMRRSRTAKIMSMRAHRILIEDRPLHFLVSPECPVKEIRILLADPDGHNTEARALEYSRIKPSMSPEVYKHDIRDSITKVGAYAAKDDRITLRLHEEPAFIRLLIIDDYLFLSYFLADVSGDESVVFRVARLSPLYRAIDRYFEWTWTQRSREHQPMFLSK